MDNLIKRARELAKLREKATEGPWEVHEISGGYWITGGRLPDFESVGEMIGRATYANSALITAAPEMAGLLEQMADELESRDRWARERCREFCKDLETRGRHASNCPAADWGLK